jgi:galactose mutarotase-like enzyme
MSEHTISQGGLRATVRSMGAELCSFQGAAGEMLWQAGPAWPRHAPVLFPIVGRLKGDTLRHDGKAYRMTQHGFARDREFTWVVRDADHCRLVLTDDEATRAMYPFAFRFEMDFRIADGALDVTYRTTNTGGVVLPASQGAHPAFHWPLADGVAKEAHVLTFEADERAPMPRVVGGLLGEATTPSPIVDRVLALNEGLFAEDALILPRPASRWVRYTAPGVSGLEMRWEGFPSFAVWMRPPGDFLCLEPWAGMASPADWDGDFVDKPGVELIAPGGELVSRFSLRVLD